jgi:hypothetical protein
MSRICTVIMLPETVNIFANESTGGRFWEIGKFLHPYLIIEIGRSCNCKGRRYSVLKYE